MITLFYYKIDLKFNNKNINKNHNGNHETLYEMGWGKDTNY